jgi:hypothetical protein
MDDRRLRTWPLAVAMNVAGYWFSDRIALRASRARPLDEGSSTTQAA